MKWLSGNCLLLLHTLASHLCECVTATLGISCDSLSSISHPSLDSLLSNNLTIFNISIKPYHYLFSSKSPLHSRMHTYTCRYSSHSSFSPCFWSKPFLPLHVIKKNMKEKFQHLWHSQTFP
jgi:hypothetical protein